MLDALRQDISYSARALRSRPALTIVAVASLALGIGVNTAIFSFYEHLLLRRLAVPSPGAIVNVTAPAPRPGSSSTGDSGGVESVFSIPLFRDLERLSGVGAAGLPVTGIAAHTDIRVNVAFRRQTAEADGLLVSGGYFPALGILPTAGRLLTPADDRPGAAPVVVLGHRYWSVRFAADPTVVGGAMLVNGTPMTVVGVGADGFSGTTVTEPTDLFIPLTAGIAAGVSPAPEARDNHAMYLFARLNAGVSRESAQRALDVAFAPVRDAELPLLRERTVENELTAYAARQIVLEDGSRGRNGNRQEVQLILVLLLAVSGFVLLIACANVANLLLARVTDRATEIAVRISLGASVGRIVRLLLIEAALLGTMGGLAALGIARATVAGMLTLFPTEDVAFLQFGLSRSVLLFAMAVGIGTSCLFGLFPALHGAYGSSRAMEVGTTRVSSSRRANRFRTSLATAQIALATTLLAQAGLLITNLTAVARADLGIQREGLIGFSLAPGQSGYTPARASALFERLHEELRALPGVTSVSASTVPLLSDSNWGSRVNVQGVDVPDELARANTANVGVDYFKTLGIPVMQGREFTAADTGDKATIAVVNETFVRQFSLGSDVIGRRMRRGRRPGSPFDIEIVGVVRDSRYNELGGKIPAQFFQPYRQTPANRLTFYVRTTQDPRAIMAAIPSVVSRIDDTLPVTRLRTMTDQVWERSAVERILATLSSWLAVLAAVLAAVGLYAVLAYTVARRRREFGIRLALGARPATVRGLVVAYVARMAVVGAVIGGGVAIALGRLGASLLSGVSGVQPAVLAGAMAVIGAVIVVAGVIPARRAAAVNPASALRAE